MNEREREIYKMRYNQGVESASDWCCRFLLNFTVLILYILKKNFVLSFQGTKSNLFIHDVERILQQYLFLVYTSQANSAFHMG